MTAFLPADWPAPPGVRALTTLRHGLGGSQSPFDTFNLGSRCGDEVMVVAENRRQLEAALALPSPPRWLRQVHGMAVAVEPGDDEPEADAAVTATPGTVLAILTADCLPVVLAAKDGGEIAAAHAGWRGLCTGVLESTVGAMRTPPDQLVAWLGPAAGPQAYEIGTEVFEAFTARDGRARMAFVPTRPGHWRVDLYMLARQRLLDAGMTDVHGGGLCTISDPSRFFSHRRDGRSGRIATLAWITP
ncbi:peptidoglycan editing factor PgeF [Thermomonas sp. XSG]|jgi:YfiH family protein|uniref:peptidoglycan editing factor PgeF n=1 Tax=Thermomonas sp. XSG TaxID=2771436 RepID=UPI0016816162|nr:peptidoglycan editing factor PgeF [Thermomonas sp. XSG]QNU15603.1 peptidoglycan editing factor PgeF [Thermomonas sp. XSG]